MSEQPLEEILIRTMALEPESRGAYLDEVYAANPAARSELESLLAVAERFPLPGDLQEDADPQNSAPLPERIGRYPVVGIVGVGGMGRVYRALDPELEREVALKRLPTGIQDDPAALARFRREARVLARLRHPNIATVHSLESDSEAPFLTMELVPGRTLHQVLTEGSLPMKRALGIGVQIAAAMEAAHAEGIVHRDLKPLNIQVGEADELKVLDFGLAKAVDEPAMDGEGATVVPTGAMGPVTMTGLVVGTPGYISPEHLLGRPVGPAADVWAFGCILFECLAGSSPYPASGSAARVPTRFRNPSDVLEREPDWSLLPDGIPAAVREFLRACLCIEPSERPSAAAARRSLETALRSIEAPSFAFRVQSRSSAVVLVCMLAMVVGVVMVDREQRPPPVGVPHSSVRQLTFRGNAVACDLAPDGETAAYFDESGHLVYLDLQTNRERPGALIAESTGDTIATLGTRAVSLRWSPDGRELAVTGARKPALMAMSTYLVARDGHQAVDLGVRDFAGVVWSPDGSRIAGTSGVASRGALCIAERRTGLHHEVPLEGPVRPAQVMDWAAGDWIFFRGVESDSVYVVSADGGTPRAVLHGGFLRCLPDRSRICYFAENQLRTTALDSRGTPGASYQVLADRVQQTASLFSLARDGRRILYNNREVMEAWLGERGADRSGDGGFRWTRLERGSITTFGTRFSPDGTRAALVARPKGEKDSQLQILNLADGSRKTVAKDRAIGCLDWSPDGSELVYRNDQGMVRVGLEGGPPSHIPGTHAPMYIRWLPDGRIFYMEREGDMWHAYSQIDPVSGRITRLPIDQERGTLFQFAVAPDGNRLAVAGNRGDRDMVKVWLIDLADGSERLLYDGWAAPFEWSDDGRWVYLVTEIQPDFANRRRSQVFRVAVERGEVEHVTDLPEPVFSWNNIDLSPDGRRIAFDQRRTGRDLWLMDIEPIRK